MEIIKEFCGPHAFLSNFWPFQGKKMIGPPCPISFNGLVFKTSEHLFQWFKAISFEEGEWIRACEFPGEAKRLGRQIRCRQDWKLVAEPTMQFVVEQKFLQNPDLIPLLLNTGDAFLEEGNWWGDDRWGIDLKTGTGKNILGKIHMANRSRWTAPFPIN